MEDKGTIAADQGNTEKTSHPLVSVEQAGVVEHDHKMVRNPGSDVAGDEIQAGFGLHLGDDQFAQIFRIQLPHTVPDQQGPCRPGRSRDEEQYEQDFAQASDQNSLPSPLPDLSSGLPPRVYLP